MVAGMLAVAAGIRPEFDQRKGNHTAAAAHMNDVAVAESEISTVENLVRPAHAHSVRNAGGEHAAFNGDIAYIVPGRGVIRGAVAGPVALQGKVIVGGADEGIAHHRVAAAEPVHAVLVGVARAAADDLDVVECNAMRILHLDHPGAAAHEAGNAFDGDVPRVIHDDGVPVAFVHPAFVVVRILRAVVDDGAPAKYLYVLHAPDVDASEDDGAGSEVHLVSAGHVDVLVVDAGFVVADAGAGLRRSRFGSVRKQEQHFRGAEVVAGTGDGDLHRVFNLEGDHPAVDLGADSMAPWLHFHAFGPVVVGGGGDGDPGGAFEAEAENLVLGGGMGKLGGVAIDSGREAVAAQFGGHGKYRRFGVRHSGKDQDGYDPEDTLRQFHRLSLLTQCGLLNAVFT